ncbi:XdhC family protein [Nocardia xishanensis]|uniref:XdhC family protein n=1 Tax=Nocardia xishanensis TaxID=238964 RepID=A0ABW7XBP7_9NOCA
MPEWVDQLLEQHAAGARCALATVIDTFASAPRTPGATMVVTADGEVLGSVSGGCVEAATVATAESVLESGVPTRTTFGIAADDLFDIGLTCGGTIDIFVEKVSDALIEHLRHIQRARMEQRPIALATVISGATSATHLRYENGELIGFGDDRSLGNALRAPIEEVMASGRHALIDLALTGTETLELFVQVFSPAPRMIIFGAVDFARELCRLGKILGYHTTVCDARSSFTTPARFPEADTVVVDQPQRYLASTALNERSVLCVMTHDPKYDIPLLERALRLPVAYVGAMGSRHVSEQRLQQLRDRGVTEQQLGRLHAPIGLDIGGTTPAETAVSIAAEIIATREHRSGLPLTSAHGAIHTKFRSSCLTLQTS